MATRLTCPFITHPAVPVRADRLSGGHLGSSVASGPRESLHRGQGVRSVHGVGDGRPSRPAPLEVGSARRADAIGEFNTAADRWRTARGQLGCHRPGQDYSRPPGRGGMRGALSARAMDPSRHAHPQQRERCGANAASALAGTALHDHRCDHHCPCSRLFATVRPRSVCRLTCADESSRTSPNPRPTSGGRGRRFPSCRLDSGESQLTGWFGETHRPLVASPGDVATVRPLSPVGDGAEPWRTVCTWPAAAVTTASDAGASSEDRVGARIVE
jgi:hypothetical protein